MHFFLLITDINCNLDLANLMQWKVDVIENFLLHLDHWTWCISWHKDISLCQFVLFVSIMTWLHHFWPICFIWRMTFADVLQSDCPNNQELVPYCYLQAIYIVGILVDLLWCMYIWCPLFGLCPTQPGQLKTKTQQANFAYFSSLLASVRKDDCIINSTCID